MESPYILALAIPFITWGTHQALEELRKYRAYKRLKNDPLFSKDAFFRSLESEGRDRPLIHNGKILDYGRGYVHIEGYNKDGVEVRATFTCREFEKLTPLWA